MLTQQQALDCYKKTGAILKGHFKLTSGRHSDTYMQSAKLFIDTKQSEIVCKALAEKLAGEKIDLVVSPAIGGILMGYEVARQLGVPNIFAERENGEMTLRRGFSIEKGTKVRQSHQHGSRVLRRRRMSALQRGKDRAHQAGIKSGI